jgi:hypothetical protein
MTPRERLARAQAVGYFLTREPYDAVGLAYRLWCRRNRRPYVVVAVEGKFAVGLLWFEYTDILWPAPRAHLIGGTLSEAGEKIVRAFFDGCQSPRVRLTWGGGAGSRTFMQLSRVPATEADALGLMLFGAATSATPGPGVETEGLSAPLATMVVSASAI